jgi:TPP-dependent pyruvate/acetoin dehydrogenase alpha subunit
MRKLPREQLIGFLAEMLLIRRFEEKVTERASAPASSPGSCMPASARRRSRSASVARWGTVR